jgi:cysteine-rich repeat protein
MNFKSLTRCIIVSLAFLCILLVANSQTAYAGIRIAVGPDYPDTVTVGDTNVDVTIAVKNDSFGGEITHDVYLESVKHRPSCKSGAAGACTLAADPANDPDVFEFTGGLPNTATGQAGSACAGVIFTVTLNNAATGELLFTPPTPTTITLPAPSPGPATDCIIPFKVDVVKLPADSDPGTAGLQTTQHADASGRSKTNNSLTGSGSGTDTTTVEGCGDSIVQSPETCDPPLSTPTTPSGNTNLCRNDGPPYECTYCGDGVLQAGAGEECDDGNHVNGDGCDNDCTVSAYCGDGVINQANETCDTNPRPPVNGDPGDLRACRAVGVPAECTYCGDGIKNNGEQCDDGNSINDDDCSNDCKSTTEAICRTPGFWGEHAGTMPNKKNSQNITQMVINACDGCLEVCGEVIKNTNLNSADSALEALCVNIAGDIRLQLARQLTAMALNCCISGFGPNCSDDPGLYDLFSNCNAICPNGAPEDMDECKDKVDCFNNGGIINEDLAELCQTGTCSDNDAPCNENDLHLCGVPLEATCIIPLPGNCHDQPLVGLGLNFDPPGPAGSSDKCDVAKAIKKSDNNSCAILPKLIDNGCSKFNQGEQCCATGTKSDIEETCATCAGPSGPYCPYPTAQPPCDSPTYGICSSLRTATGSCFCHQTISCSDPRVKSCTTNAQCDPGWACSNSCCGTNLCHPPCGTPAPDGVEAAAAAAVTAAPVQTSSGQ